MNLGGHLKFIEQALLIRVMLESLGTIVAVLFCLTFAAFVIYLIGIFHLCHTEFRRRNFESNRPSRTGAESTRAGSSLACDWRVKSCGGARAESFRRARMASHDTSA